MVNGFAILAVGVSLFFSLLGCGALQVRSHRRDSH